MPLLQRRAQQSAARFVLQLPPPNPPPRAGEGFRAAAAGTPASPLTAPMPGTALLLPPLAGEGLDGGSSGRGRLRRCRCCSGWRAQESAAGFVLQLPPP